jgi:ABC-type branched-subunit amino acid transport system substrate-binding protein
MRAVMGSRCHARHLIVLLFLCTMALSALASGCAAVTLTRPVVKIGLVAPFEGEYRYVGYDAINAARLAIREASASGSLDVSVELVPYDDRGIQDRARTAALNLTQDDQVIAAIGHYLDHTSVAAKSIYSSAGIPMIVAGTVAGSALDPEFDALCPLVDYLERARENGGEQAPSPLRIHWIVDERQPLPDCSADHEIVTNVDLPQLEAVDVVLLTGDPMAAGEAFAALQEVGWKGTVAGGPSLSSPLFREIAGNPQGVVFITPSRFPDAGDADFSGRYRSIGPHVPEPGPFALTTHAAVSAVLEAVGQAERSGETPTRNTVGQHLDHQVANDVFYIYQWAEDGIAQILQSGIHLDAE